MVTTLDPKERDKQYRYLREMGDACAAAESYVEAREYYNQAAALVPQEPGPYLGLGLVSVRTGKLADAHQAFCVAIEKQPQCSEAYGGLGMVHQQVQDYEMAFEMYLKSLELDNDNMIALLGLFQTSCQMGTFSKIIYFLEVYLHKHPDDASVLFCLASLYAREGLFAKAHQALRNVLRAEPNKVEAAKMLADVTQRLESVSPVGL